MREKELQSVEKSIQERKESLEEWDKSLKLISDGLEMREKELDRKGKEHGLKQHEPALASYQNFTGSNVVSSLIEVGEPESLPAKEAPGFSSNLQLSDSKSLEARSSQGRGSGNDMLENQCLAKLESSLDPTKLVLDWMQTYLSHYWTKGDVGFEVTSIIKTSITLLEQLMRLPPHAGAQVKEDTTKLAIHWKANMRADTQNSLENLGFLHFIATFRLLDTLNVDEILKLLGMISQHKEALELCQTLGFDKIPEFIRTLVERKQLMGAVRLICTFKLIDKFPPGPLLKEYMEEEIMCCRNAYKSTKLHDEKVRIVDDQITRLRSTMNLIKYYKLESEGASMKIEKQITQLQHVKGNWRFQLGNVQTEPKRGTKRSSDTLSSTFEPSLQPNKFHRTVVPAPRPPALYSYNPISAQSGPSSLRSNTRFYLPL